MKNKWILLWWIFFHRPKKERDDLANELLNNRRTVFFIWFESPWPFKVHSPDGFERLENKDPRSKEGIDNVSGKRRGYTVRSLLNPPRLQVSIAKCPQGTPLRSNSALELSILQHFVHYWVVAWIKVRLTWNPQFKCMLCEYCDDLTTDITHEDATYTSIYINDSNSN